MSEKFPIFHCNLNIVTTFLSNIDKYFIATLQFQLFEIFLKTNKYSVLLGMLYKYFDEMILHTSIIYPKVANDDRTLFFSTLYF